MSKQVSGYALRAWSRPLRMEASSAAGAAWLGESMRRSHDKEERGERNRTNCYFSLISGMVDNFG